MFGYRFELPEVSERDFWHPSLAGQRSLAAVTWGAGYWP